VLQNSFWLPLACLIFLSVVAVLSFNEQDFFANQQTDQLHEQQVEFTAYVQQQLIKSSRRQQLRLKVVTTTDQQLLKQKILLNAYRYPSYAKGSYLQVTCLLQRPQPFDGFAYDRYLASQGVYWLCDQAQVEEINRPVLWQQQPFEYARIKLAGAINELWPRPTSSLAAGLLLGSRESFPASTLSDFSRAGVTHIIALSGFNITILIVFFDGLAVRLLVKRRLRFFLVVSTILVFTIFVGAGASIVRAAIMGSLVLLAKQLARQVSPGRLLLFSAAVMTVENPYILVYDLGFQLSFLATIGLLYFPPFFERVFFFVPKAFALQESLVTTMAASLMAWPLLIYHFEHFSLVSPLDNMLILPLIPWEMAVAALTIVLYLIWAPLALLTKFLVSLGSQYILSVSHLLAQPTWASRPWHFSTAALLASFIGLFVLIVFSQRYASQNS